MPNLSQSVISWEGLDTDGTPAKVGAVAVAETYFNGGQALFVAEGTWGSGTITLKFRPVPGGTRLTFHADTTVTADAVVGVTLGRGVYSPDLSGSTGADLNVYILPA